ncbi:MAG: TPM domain-containing protein, partial [Caulobacteraceae bacterium]
MKTLACALALLVLLAAGAAGAAPKFPPLTGRVVDDAHVLSPQVQAELTDKLAGLEAKTSRQLVVVTLPSLGGYAIEDYGYQLLRAWGIGQKATNNGALFIIVPSEHKVRIEVGYGLEPILTDALSSVILQRAVLPKFRAGDVQGGVVAGTDEIIAQLAADPSAAEAKAAQAEQAAQTPGGPSGRGFPIQALFPLLFIVFFLVSSIFRGRGGGGMGWFLPAMIMSGGLGGRGWSGGGGFGG